MDGMRRMSLLAALLSGCLHQAAHISADGAVLGRVVVYRNGVAFYERHATVKDGALVVHVPRDRVDDFLKSLTVIDAATHRPLAISIPRKENGDAAELAMTLYTPERRSADVVLRYVTEAPAWKPSYRVVLEPRGKVELEGWAIVDNVSGEDWRHVLVGVGASSALSFRYDLWSVRHVDRTLLQDDQRFATAPPAGVSPYAETGATEVTELDPDEVRIEGSADLAATGGAIRGVVTDKATRQPLAGVTVVAKSAAGGTQSALTRDDGTYEIAGLPPGAYEVSYFYADLTVDKRVEVRGTQGATASLAINTSRAGGEQLVVQAHAPVIDPTSTTGGITIDRDYTKTLPVAGRTFEATVGAAAGSEADAQGMAVSGSLAPAISPISRGDAKLHGIARTAISDHKDLVIEAHGTSFAEVQGRAAAVRDALIDDGVAAPHIHVAPKVGPTEGTAIRVLAVAPGTTPAGAAGAPPAASHDASDAPVGESHFMADRPMTVPSGTSAMIAMVHARTDGGIVYLYDPISDRGDARYAFKAVRLDNPTGDTLESGPVTVYGDGRFVGEGIADPVPPHASVVVPFALDREVVVARREDTDDRIAHLESVQRGAITAQLQHRIATHLTLTSRLAVPTTVFLRHRLQSGWTLVAAPKRSMTIGDSQLFEVQLGAGQTEDVEIVEATPVERTLDLTSDDALALLTTYLDAPGAPAGLRAQVQAVLDTHRAAAELADRIRTLHDQLDEYRAREGELHAQLVSLQAVRTGGELVPELRHRLTEISARVQQATLAVVDAQERLMLLHVKLANQLADLHLPDAPGAISAR